MSAVQLGLFEPSPRLPEGFDYKADLLSPAQEQELLGRFAHLNFREFAYREYLGKRRVVSFGMHYDFTRSAIVRAEDIPAFLIPLRDSAAVFARIAPSELQHALVTEYAPGAAIGWHRDRPVFKDVIGVSFGSSCRFRFRRKRSSSWERASQIVQPRSIYRLRGAARTEWEHSIPPAERLRYSVTFRSLVAATVC
jgi:alkylated DNA repair dioxygenase AlkB